MARKVSPRKQNALKLIAKRYAGAAVRKAIGCNSNCSSKCKSV